MRCLLALCVSVAARTWTADDLVPVLTAAVEAQLGKCRFTCPSQNSAVVSEALKLDESVSAFSFKQVDGPSPKQMLRDEIEGFVKDMWEAEREFAARIRPTKSLSPSFRQMQEWTPPEIEPLDLDRQNFDLFEMDADEIQRIFNTSLEAAVKPLKQLFRLQETPEKPTVSWLDQFQSSGGIKKVPEPKEGFPISMAIGDLTFIVPVHKLLRNRRGIEKFMADTQRHFNETAFIWPTLGRLADVQADVLPILNDLMPHFQRMSYRSLAALLELSPRRLNSVTVLPALLEVLTVTTLMQGTMETTMPLFGILLGETEDALTVIKDYLPFLRTYLVDVQQALPVMADLDSHYAPLATALAQNLQALQLFLPDVELFIPEYLKASPSIRRIVQIMSGMNGDFSTSLDYTLDRLAREAPRIMEFYDRTEEFVPIIVSNLISTLRRTGLPARFPSIRAQERELTDILPALRGLITNATVHLPRISETLIPVAACIPRHPGLATAASDLLIHTSMAVNAFNTTALPSIVSMLDVVNPFVDTLNSPVLNVVVFLPLLVAVVSSAVATIPRLTAVTPTISPVMRSMSSLTSYIRPLVPAAQEFASATAGLNQTQTDRLIDAISTLLTQIPSLFDQPLIFSY